MNKIPVGETIRFAYGFAFGQLGTIIGLIWVPMVAIAVLRFLPYGLGDAHPSPEQNPTAAGAAALRQLVFALASILLYASINVAVMRQALGLRKGGAVIHFALGAAEFRMWGAMLLLLAILIALTIGFFLAVFGATLAGAVLGSKMLAGAIGGGVALIGLCLLLVSIVRLAFLVVPITVAENKISFERGWLLTRGNFWRISTVVFVVTLPTVTIVFGAFFALMGGELMALIPVASHIGEQALAERVQAIMDSHIPTIIGINLIVAPFSLGLTLGAAAAGYKALTAPPRPFEAPHAA